MKKRKGIYIAFEGIDGSGKTVQEEILAKSLTSMGYRVDMAREPGSSAIAEEIRFLLKKRETEEVMDPITQVLLFNAARRQFIASRLSLLLKEETIIVASRCFLSTLAYQGYGENGLISLNLIKIICGLVIGSAMPDKIFLMDVSIKEAKRRILASRDKSKSDRFESRGKTYHRLVREGYLIEASNYSVEIINGERPVKVIAAEILKKTLELIRSRNYSGRRK